MGGWGIVGGHVPLANGVGWAINHKRKTAVVFAFRRWFMHQGAFFEALCLAQLYKLPCIFICENNGYEELLWKDNLQSPNSVVEQTELE